MKPNIKYRLQVLLICLSKLINYNKDNILVIPIMEKAGVGKEHIWEMSIPLSVLFNT